MFTKEIAEQYDSWYESKLGSFVDETETECAFHLLQPASGEELLDVGCGTGNFSIKMARWGSRVIGIDISESMLHMARKKLEGKSLSVTFKKMDAQDLQFEDERFDGALAMATIEFLDAPQQAFNEMMRVTKPGGRVVIGLIHRDSPWGELYQQYGQEGDAVFSNAKLKSRGELQDLDPDHLVRIDSCLFLPPDTPEEKIGWLEEAERSKDHPAGFLCGLWRKPE